MKIGVWGLGSIGLRHARNLLAKGYTIYGYDPSTDRQALLQTEGGVIVPDSKALLQEADAVVICTPNHLHKNNLQEAIENNCHVLIEKPLATDTNGLYELVQMAKAKGLIIAPAMNMRFDDVVLQARDIIQSSTLGKPVWANFSCNAYLPSWRPHQDYKKGYTNNPQTGGVLFDIIHEFDIAYFILGDMQVAHSYAINSGVIDLQSEDYACVHLQNHQKCLIQIRVDYISQFNQRYFEIQLEKGYLKADLNKREILVFDHQNQIQKTFPIGQSDTECYSKEIDNFIEALQDKKDFLCSFEDSIKVLEIVIQSRKQAGLPW